MSIYRNKLGQSRILKLIFILEKNVALQTCNNFYILSPFCVFVTKTDVILINSFSINQHLTKLQNNQQFIRRKQKPSPHCCTSFIKEHKRTISGPKDILIWYVLLLCLLCYALHIYMTITWQTSRLNNDSH